MSRLSRWFLVVALLISMGLPWACLQSVGWINMMVNYSRQTSFIKAVSMTFDGRHPCNICKAVTEHEKTAQQSVAKSEKIKLIWAILGVDKFISLPIMVSMVQDPLCDAEQLYGSPPTPPPKQGS